MKLPKEFLSALKEIFGKRLLTDPSELITYSYDASSLLFQPDAVIFPENKEEVLEVLRLADYFEVPVISRGSGTATTGSPLAIKGGVILSLTRMNRILEIIPEERIVRVEPGVLNGDLKNYLKKYNLFYPPDPASYAFSTLGGNVATGAGGPKGLKYGTTKDYVLALEVGLPGGKLLKTGALTLKSVVPYNITPLFVGSEGTLGIFVEILLKLLPLPPKRELFLILSPQEELSLQIITDILLKGLTPTAAEFVDKTTLQAIKDLLKQKVPLKEKIESLLFVELDGEEGEVKKASEIFSSSLKGQGLDFLKAETEREIEELWEIRRAISPSLKKLRTKKIADDVVVPRRNIIIFLKFLRHLEKESQILISAFGHAGDGNFHINLLFEEEEREKAIFIREKILKKVLELFGSLSGEHGIGYTKKPYLLWELDPLQIEIMRKLKALFDPKGILNPHIKLPTYS